MEKSSISCVNCGSSSIRLQRYLIEHLGPDIISLLNQWLPQTELSDQDYICSECLNCVLRSLNNTGGPVIREVGHQHVCSWCGVSIQRKRNTILHINSPERLHIEQNISPRLLPNNARACYACWIAAKRNIQRQELLDNNRQLQTPYRAEDSIQQVQQDLLQHQPEQINPIASRADFISINDDELDQPGELDPHVDQPGEDPHVDQPGEDPHLDQPEEDPLPQQPGRLVLPNYKRTAGTPNHCIYPGCNNLERYRVPTAMRIRLLSDSNLFVLESSRICIEHLQLYNWNPIVQENSFINSFTIQHMEKMIVLLSKTPKVMILDFENIENWASHLIHYWVGHSLEKFNTIIQQCPTLRILKKAKSILGTYLLKMRTGDSNNRISTLLQKPPSTIRLWLKKIRKILTEEFLPNYLGLHTIQRQDIINNRNLTIANGLFGGTVANPKAIVLADATYVYTQKSSNYKFQKDSYSTHKHRNLIKPFVLVTSDGYILDVWGPYSAGISDAIILKNLLTENGPIRTYFIAGDSFILDRGFRDVIQYLKDLNYEPHVPLSIVEGEFQMPTIRANKSRCVTICRWVIEVVNGRFKRDFKLLRQTYFNTTCKNVMTDFRIAAALINAFHAPISDRPDAVAILNRLRSRMNVPNTLADFIESNNINRRRASFVTINNGDIPELDVFPILTMDHLEMFALGTYQIKQARSYYGEHIRLNGTYKIEVCQNIERIGNIDDNYSQLDLNTDDLLIRAKMQSRHHTGKVYFVYLLLCPTLNTDDPVNLIKGYCCNCIVGRRTVGCCAHVMTVVWYLGWARHQANINAPATGLDGLLLREED